MGDGADSSCSPSPVIRRSEGVRYRWDKLIGEGSFGKVFLGSRHDIPKLVLKEVVLRDMTKRQTELALSEVGLLEQFSHPNIIHYIDAFLTQHSLVLVLEYAEKGDLSMAIKKQRGAHFAENKILEWFIQITAGLNYIHRRNVLHRDLKTQNLLLTQADTVKLADFGIAFQAGPDNVAQSAVGTPYFLSPEICKQEKYDQKTDMWSAGVCLYQLAALRLPFEGKDLADVVGRIKTGFYMPLPPCYSSMLHSLVASLLQMAPTRRPTAAAILGKSELRSFVLDYERRFNVASGRGLSGSSQSSDSSQLRRSVSSVVHTSHLRAPSPRQQVVSPIRSLFKGPTTPKAVASPASARLSVSPTVYQQQRPSEQAPTSENAKLVVPTAHKRKADGVAHPNVGGDKRVRVITAIPRQPELRQIAHQQAHAAKQQAVRKPLQAYNAAQGVRTPDMAAARWSPKTPVQRPLPYVQVTPTQGTDDEMFDTATMKSLPRAAKVATLSVERCSRLFYEMSTGGMSHSDALLEATIAFGFATMETLRHLVLTAASYERLVAAVGAANEHAIPLVVALYSTNVSILQC